MRPIVGADVGYVVGAEFGASVGTAVCDFVGAEGETLSAAQRSSIVSAQVSALTSVTFVGADIGDYAGAGACGRIDLGPDLGSILDRSRMDLVSVSAD